MCTNIMFLFPFTSTKLYRAASPTAKDILRQLCPTGAATGVPPKITEDRAIDESGVDGIGMLELYGEENFIVRPIYFMML